ncbi:MAG: hypothetical protein JWM57_185 [Phycisphaerales bacterium]|nr:hypothetical protein [Phycisphaerales bacterium]
MNDQRQPVAKSPVLLVIVWAVVTIPALWGVSKTVQTSLKLFQTPAVATSQPMASPATTPASNESVTPHPATMP